MHRRPNGPAKPIELYDLASDLSESKDLAAEKPDLVAKADSLMKSMRVDHPDWPLVEMQPGKEKAAKKKLGATSDMPRVKSSNN